jgi:hypothetical protein
MIADTDQHGHPAVEPVDERVRRRNTTIAVPTEIAVETRAPVASGTGRVRPGVLLLDVGSRVPKRMKS